MEFSHLKIKLWFVVAAVLLLNAAAAQAVSLSEYQRNARTAAAIWQNAKTQADFESNIKLTKQLLPARETIEIGNARIEVDNKWLEPKFKETREAKSEAERLAVAKEIGERLGGVEKRLDEFSKANLADNPKNADKQKLDEILKRPEFKKPEKSLWQKWWEDFWKRDEKKEQPKEAEPEFEPPSNLEGLASILRFVVIALAVIIIGFVIWRFVVPLFGKKRVGRKRAKKEPRVILGETLAADETAENLLSEAEKLALSGNIRAAIRKGYIALLCDLSDRKILGLAQHKTNRDYLRDVSKRDEKIFEPVKFLTGSFETHWYGAVPADESDWQEFRQNYRQASNK